MRYQSGVKYNPFQPNKIVAPGMFVGRVDELFTIEQSLFQAKNGNPLHFIIEGERGIGKSSLLYIASNLAAGSMTLRTDPMRFVVLSVDLGNAHSQLDIVTAIARELRAELKRRNFLQESAKKVWDFLSNWEVLGVRYHKAGSAEAPDDARDILIDQIATLCSGEDCILDGVFIIIDEADAPPVDAGLGEFMKTFTERLTRRGCERVLVGLGGLPALIAKLSASHESSPRIFSVLGLKPLEHDERMEVVQKGLEVAEKRNQFKIGISDDALELIARLSEGYPHFVQQFAYSAFDANKDNVIDVGDVLDGTYGENGAIAQLGSKYFNQMYFGRISSDEYRKVLDAMSDHSDNWVARKVLQKESGVSQSTIANALTALKNREIIIADPSRQGYYRLPTKSFAAWISAIRSVEERTGGDENLFAGRE
jgi:DNA-binding transcriptional ArsR family regulator